MCPTSCPWLLELDPFCDTFPVLGALVSDTQVFNVTFLFQVKYWITFNEPKVIILAGYGEAYFPPRGQSIGVGVYQAAHNLIKCHAAAYNVYDRKQNGKPHLNCF